MRSGGTAVTRRNAPRRRFRRSFFRPALEHLERRLAPAAVQWTGGAGTLNWTDAKNWSTQALPGSGDDVTINIGVNGPIAIASGTQSVGSIADTTASLTLSGGTL